MPLTNNRYPYYFNRYMNIPELFAYINFNNVTEKVLLLLKTLDDVSEDDLTKVEGLIDLTFGMLGSDGYLSGMITRWQYNSNIMGIEQYMARMLYDATLEIWMKKQYLNASMNWKTLNDLLSKDTERTSTDNLTDKKEWTNLDDRNSKIDSTHADLDSASQYTGDPLAEVRKNEYLAGGNLDETSTTNTNKGSGNSNDTQKRDHTFKENVQQVKFDYLKPLYDMIEKNSFLFERYFGNFLFSLTWPQQNPETDEFPWPWTLSNRRVIW